MYEILLTTHSLLRWAVLATGLWAFFGAWRGWRTQSPWTGANKGANLAFLIATDLQLILGLLLQLVYSPLVSAAMADMKSAMKVPLLRFFAVEHVTLMLVAVALMHVGYGRAKRQKTEVEQHKAAAIFFGLALVCMLAAIPWPFRGAVARPLLPF